MELVKILAVTFNPKPELIYNCEINYGGITIEFHKLAPDNEADLLISAKIKLLEFPKLTKNNFIVITAKETKPLEYAIENIVNLFVFSNRISKKIGAVAPSIVFNPESEDERKWLDSTNGLLINKNRLVISSSFTLDFEFCVKNLYDRLDGVSLIAEALSSSSDTGKFHDFIRLFERAFKLSSKNLIEPLYNFLSNTKLEYKKREIEEWISIRHGITHADLKEDFLIESDVSYLIKRIEQAAYDVLINKAIWRSHSHERRELFKIDFGMNAANKIVITRGSEGRIEFQILDETCSYRTLINNFLTKLPNGWWTKGSNMINIKNENIKVI